MDCGQLHRVNSTDTLAYPKNDEKIDDNSSSSDSSSSSSPLRRKLHRHEQVDTFEPFYTRHVDEGSKSSISIGSSSVSQNNVRLDHHLRQSSFYSLQSELTAVAQKFSPVIIKSSESAGEVNCERNLKSNLKNKKFRLNPSLKRLCSSWNPLNFQNEENTVRKIGSLNKISLKSTEDESVNSGPIHYIEPRLYPPPPELRIESPGTSRRLSNESDSSNSSDYSQIRSLSSYSYSTLSTPEPPVPKNLFIRYGKPILLSIISKIEDPRSPGG